MNEKEELEDFLYKNIDLRQMIKDFRGNYPDKCDYCEKKFDELHPVLDL